MAEVIGEAALGVVVGDVLRVVTDVKNKAVQFKSILRRLESTLESVIPKINEIEQLNQNYNYLKKDDIYELIILLQKGEVLLLKCSMVAGWNYWKKYQYSKKLLEFEASLYRFSQLNLQVEALRDIKLLLLSVKELNERLDRMTSREINGMSPTTSNAKLSSSSSNVSDYSWFTAESGDGEKPDGQIFPTPKLRIFTYLELKAATRNFRADRIMGEGGFGQVFKAWFQENTAWKSGIETVFAVKKLSPQSLQGLKEWKTEVDFLGRLSHPNLIKLLGYSSGEQGLLLVYEFMPKGSLDNHLFGRGSAIQPLSWHIRLKIAIGAARGLAFLHASEDSIIKGDVKSSDILLDGSYDAKISDFGLARKGPLDGESHVSTRVMGTCGYAAPEYVATGRLYVKSDVYGYGVVLVEMLTGLRSVDKKRPTGQRNLIDWAIPHLTNRRKIKKIMDSKMEGRYPPKAVEKIAHLALKCLGHDPTNRPSMEEVVQTLERIMDADEPIQVALDMRFDFYIYIYKDRDMVNPNGHFDILIVSKMALAVKEITLESCNSKTI